MVPESPAVETPQPAVDAAAMEVTPVSTEVLGEHVVREAPAEAAVEAVTAAPVAAPAAEVAGASLPVTGAPITRWVSLSALCLALGLILLLASPKQKVAVAIPRPRVRV